MATVSVGQWILPSLLLSLRIAPAFAFAPPFSLVPSPVLFRGLLAVGLAACLAATDSSAANFAVTGPRVAEIALGELMIGVTFMLVLQLTFAALYTAGRIVDIQTGYGLALLIDPTTRGQSPLVGTVLAYTAGAVFVSVNGPAEVLLVFATSLRKIPFGTPVTPAGLITLSRFMSTIFMLGFGVVGGVILCLFIVDMTIALMSRTLPQMNVLVIGFQAKTLVALFTLPIVLGASGALLLRMMRVALEAMLRLL